MIDSQYLIRYTDALYSVTEDLAPSYTEFRDMFSSGQIYSKQWILRELKNIDPIHQRKEFAIAGAWFGTLGMAIKSTFPSTKVTMIDIDPRCEKFIEKMIHQNPDMKAVTEDMYEYEYSEDYVINTSCEHISDVRDWLSVIPPGTTVILQSNNFYEGDGHINCVDTEYEFIKQTNLSDIMFSGKLVLPMYTRFMIIGNT
jgi:hypothetical protein